MNNVKYTWHISYLIYTKNEIGLFGGYVMDNNGLFLQLAISVIYGITPIVYFARKVMDRVES